MGCVQFLLCLSLTVVALSVCAKGACLVTNVDCLTRGAQEAFNTFVPGIEGMIDPSDPMYLDEVNGFVPNVSYRLSNLTLTGFKQCQVTLLRLNIDDTTYQYNLNCPHLVLNYHHKATGFLGPIEVDTNGLSRIIFNNYIMKINGKYGKVDDKNHFNLDKFNLETEVQGRFAVESQSPLHNNETKSDLVKTYIDQHSKEIEKYLKSPTMEKFVAIFLNHLDLFLRNYGFEIKVSNDV